MLNRDLYMRMQMQFGRTAVSHPGVAVSYESTDDPEGRGFRRADVRHWGETYRANCPFCRESRRRLYVCHAYDLVGPGGETFRGLAHCFNETDCLGNRRNREELWRSLRPQLLNPPRRDKMPGRVLDEADLRPQFPKNVLPIDSLDVDHPAAVYLRDDRGFDLHYLWSRFRVGYCPESEILQANRRIIIPVYSDGRAVGWQGRKIGDGGGDAFVDIKYLSAPHWRKSQYLLNYDFARLRRTIVLCEGPTDAFRVGLCGVCTFGASISPTQIGLLTAAVREGVERVVWAWDGDLAAKNIDLDETRRQLQESLGSAFLEAEFPPDVDPGSLNSDVLLAELTHQAAKRGVHLSFSERVSNAAKKTPTGVGRALASRR